MSYNRWLTPNNPYDCSPSELYHYGVMGMKWGVRKAQKYNQKIGANHWKQYKLEDKARKHGTKVDKNDPRVKKWGEQNREYDAKREKAVRDVVSKSKTHLQRLDEKYQKKQAKADKAYEKAERKAHSLLTSKKGAERAFKKAANAQYKANKVAYKGKQFYNQMMREFRLYGNKWDRYSLFYKQVDKDTRKLGRDFVKRVERSSQAMYANSYS